MGRELKRVPLDFDWPIKAIWPGYCNPFWWTEPRVPVPEEIRDKYGEMFSDRLHIDPPVGKGFQLWETTTEGSPVSPVFKTIEELCEWCAVNATTFASFKATKEEWRQMLDDGFVHKTIGNATFI